jgi:hypothetical protein
MCSLMVFSWGYALLASNFLFLSRVSSYLFLAVVMDLFTMVLKSG